VVFDGFITGGAVFGGIDIGETRPAGVVAGLDGCEPGGRLDCEASHSMQVMDKSTNTGQIVGIESCWCLRCPCGCDVVIGNEQELPQPGTILLTPTFRSMEPSWAKTVLAVLSKTTLQSLLQSLPIPIKLCWKDGMILALRLGRLS
jgi:hypothetical protein